MTKSRLIPWRVSCFCLSHKAEILSHYVQPEVWVFVFSFYNVILGPVKHQVIICTHQDPYSVGKEGHFSIVKYFSKMSEKLFKSKRGSRVEAVYGQVNMILLKPLRYHKCSIIPPHLVPWCHQVLRAKHTKPKFHC